MTISQAVAKRISKLLSERNLSQYRLERNIALSHNTMKSIMTARNDGVNLKTVALIVKGLDVTLSEFFDDPLFESDELEVD